MASLRPGTAAAGNTTNIVEWLGLPAGSYIIVGVAMYQSGAVYTVGNGSTGDIYGTSTETGTVITTVSFASTTHIFFNIKPTADYRIYNDGRYFKLFVIRVRSA